MKLIDYIAQPGITASDLAAKCGVSVSTITRAARGESNPSRPLIREIARQTKGSVKELDW